MKLGLGRSRVAGVFSGSSNKVWNVSVCLLSPPNEVSEGTMKRAPYVCVCVSVRVCVRPCVRAQNQ